MKFKLIILGMLLISACSATPQPTQWQRVSDPVLRDPIAQENYEVASDPHVFMTQNNALRMVYSGDDAGVISIKLATGTDWQTWEPSQTLLGPSTGHALPRFKETPFVHKSGSEYQIYFIGYADESTYESEIFLAVSDTVTGPYQILPDPVIPRGVLAGKKVHTITSPSVIEHDGKLLIAFLGWNDFQNVSEVWVLGGESLDNGRTWRAIREVDVPIGMEGQITPLPDGNFAAVSTKAYKSREAIYMSMAPKPFGPYTKSPNPILVQEGGPWETDELIAPQLAFDNVRGDYVLFYTGADHKKGWWVRMARPVF